MADLCKPISMFHSELSNMTAMFAKSAAMLGTAEEHTALSRALSQLAETEERIETIHADQSEQDFFVMAELCKDYVSLLGAVKVSLQVLEMLTEWSLNSLLTKYERWLCKLEHIVHVKLYYIDL